MRGCDFLEGFRLPSIDIAQINTDKCYFNPGCAMNVYRPENETKIFEMLKKHFNSDLKLHNICCHHDPRLPAGSTIINNCAGCDRRFRSLYDGINTISLWEVLASIDDLKLPDYTGLTMSIHDSCSYRPKPQVHAAVRSLLKKMNITIIECENHGTKSICCGDNFYGRIPLEMVHEFQKKRAAEMPCDEVVVYCVSCIKAMTIGNKVARYLPDLILGLPTDPQTIDLNEYHDTVLAYIDSH